MKYIAILLLLAIVASGPAKAEDNVLKAEWQTCEKSDDCIYVINDKSCATAAVNRKFTAEANQYVSSIGGDGRAVGMDNGKPRCLNEPEAYCADHICKLMIHPE